MKKLNPPIWIAVAAGLLVVAAVIAVTVLSKRSPADAHAELLGMPDSTGQTTPSQSGLAAIDADGDGIVYQDGMHPWIVEDHPGQCPICGMDLMPVNVDEVEDGSVRISPATLQNIGVRTTPVRVESISNTARTTGRFEANEQQLAVVSPKISGWIETLHVNYEGARVAKGQPLFEIYSPELVSTQEEYLLALRNRERLSGTPAEGDADRLVEAARRRLSYWDITEEQLRHLEESGEPQKTLTLFAPASGTILSTSAVEGRRVTAGETLMQISNLSSLWLMVDVYEQNVAWVDVGAETLIELPYQPGTTLSGRVTYLYDELNPETRSLKARITVANPGLKLKPGMYATVTLHGKHLQPMPVVPEEAVVRSGEREVVILALGDGRFLPTDVVTGSQSNGLVQVLSGLQGNETVVTSAQFLIDSEARLQSAVGSMAADLPMRNESGSEETPGEMPYMQAPPAASDPHAGH